MKGKHEAIQPIPPTSFPSNFSVGCWQLKEVVSEDLVEAGTGASPACQAVGSCTLEILTFVLVICEAYLSQLFSFCLANYPQMEQVTKIAIRLTHVSMSWQFGLGIMGQFFLSQLDLPMVCGQQLGWLGSGSSQVASGGMVSLCPYGHSPPSRLAQACSLQDSKG